MKNTYFFYKKEEVSESEILIGCFAIVDTDGIIDSFKFKFDIFKDINSVISKWPWYFISKGIHTYELSDLPIHVKDCVNEKFIIEFEEEFESIKKDIFIPNYVNRDNLFFISLKNDEGTIFNELEISIAKSLTLWRIASFFMDNMDCVFEFPLYNEYINETGINISVEEFLDQILFATSKSLA